MLHLMVVDSATHHPIPCRVHLKNAEGVSQKAGDLPFFHDHFACTGQVSIELPPGAYAYEIERGPEYRPVSGAVTLVSGQDYHLEHALRRFVDLPGRNWYPGDLHIHRPPEHIEQIMLAEDLYVAPVITWWNKKNLWSDRQPPTDLLAVIDHHRYSHLMGGEDERNGGAFLYFNRSTPLEITQADKEWPSPISFLEAKGEGTWIDIEKPFWWDVPVALAHGFGDSIGLANNHMCRSSMYETEAWGKPRDVERLPPPRGNGLWSQEIYYHILNCGFRIPPSAGSASGVLPNPLGYNRVYVYVPGEFTHDKWWEGLRAGRCFVTNGPLLLARAAGELPGHVFHSASEVEIPVAVELTGNDPVPVLEIVQDGMVTRAVSYEEWAATGTLGKVQFDRSGWFLVRAITARTDTFRFASSAPYYVEVGDATKRISRTSASFFLDWVRERASRIELSDPAQRAEVLRYHDRAIAFWEDLVKRANAD
ncbi:MAG: CehA/McbA family metallohydrolase [Candidatus Hydrogenedentes bacterium]|nr:CehA/McbA family metallohydrolase [Candidatus Hydrogenedentota bacterium]